MAINAFVAGAFALITASFSVSAPAAETLLVCQGTKQGFLSGRDSGPQKRTFTIVREKDKVVSVKTDYHTFTLTRVNVASSESQPPVFRQLVIEKDQLILRMEYPSENNRIADTVIYSTGRYQEIAIDGASKGQCTVGQKVF